MIHYIPRCILRDAEHASGKRRGRIHSSPFTLADTYATFVVPHMTAERMSSSLPSTLASSSSALMIDAEPCGCCTRVTLTLATSTSTESDPPPLTAALLELRQYLLSDDTRLPVHNLLAANAPARAEDYDSYYGEEVWTRPDPSATSGSRDGHLDGTATGSTNAADDTACTGEQLGSSPPSGAAVAFLMLWVQTALRVLPTTEGTGVVLCGKYRCASDCGWATCSREAILTNPRDVLVAMRMSSLFLEDLERQAHEGHQRGGAVGGCNTLVFSLEEAVAVSVTTSFRLYFCHNDSSHSSDHRWDANTGAAAQLLCLGSQRATDVMLPELCRWTTAEENDALGVMRRRVFPISASNNSSAGTSAGASVGDAMVAYVVSQDCHGSSANVSSAEGSAASIRTILSVDVVFESASLPVYVLSAALWFPKCHADAGVAGGAANNDSADADDRSRVESDEVDDDAAAAAAFFCLFRDFDAFDAVVRQTALGVVDDANEPQRRLLFIARDADELRPLGAAPLNGGCGATPEELEELMRQMSNGIQHQGQVVPDFVRQLLQQQSHP